MKKSNGIIKLVLFIVVVGILGGFGYYYYFLRETKQQENGIFPSLSGEKINDYKNGIYSNKVKTDRSKNLLKNCFVESIDDYLVVINENYYLYHGNCLNMVFVNQGKTENLKFEKDTDTGYYIKLDGITYNKDNGVKEIVVDNRVIANDHPLSYDVLKYIIKYSEYPGYYYSFAGELSPNNEYEFVFNYNKDTNTFSLEITKGSMNYVKVMNSLDQFPYFSFITDNLVILDKNKIGDGYKSELFMYSKEGKTYDYSTMFPILVNNVVIDATWNRLFRYDSNDKIAYVLFSRTNNICDFSNNNVFYEFKLRYDYTKIGFKAPDLSRKGATEKDCDYVKKYYLTEG